MTSRAGSKKSARLAFGRMINASLERRTRRVRGSFAKREAKVDFELLAKRSGVEGAAA